MAPQVVVAAVPVLLEAAGAAVALVSSGAAVAARLKWVAAECVQAPRSECVRAAAERPWQVAAVTTEAEAASTGITAVVVAAASFRVRSQVP